MGTIINTLAIIIGGVFGSLFGNLLKERHQDTLTMACGISVLFIGISGALEGMLSIDGTSIVSKNSMLLVICLVLGGLIGEILNRRSF